MPVIYKEKVEYAYTDPGVKAHTLSWAEYQALPTAQKMNGDLYFIPDKQPEGNPSRIWTKLGTDPLTTQADDVSGAVNELNSSLASIATTKQATITIPTTSAGGLYTTDIDISNNPAIFQLLKGFSVTSSEHIVPIQIYFNNSNSIHIRIRTLAGANGYLTVYYI